MSGCNQQLFTELPSFPPIDELVITATIRTNENELRVIISKPVTAPNTPIEYVRGLSVTLSANGGTLPMRDTVITSRTAAPQPCYFVNRIQFQQGERYEIRVKYKGAEIVGSTSVPEKTQLTAPRNEIRWTRTSAKFYRVSVNAIPVSPLTFGFFIVTSDTSLTIPKIGGTNAAPFVNGRYAIRIESLDENLSRFMRNESLREGLSAGYGVVGSISVQTDTLMLSRD